MNKKGFTLIELLAVIVILAVIMVIAVPKILDVIENSRKSAAKSSAELYIDAIEKNNTIASIDKNVSKINDGTYDVTKLNVNVKGEKPTKGEVIIENGKVKNADMCVNGYNVILENRNIKILKDDSCAENLNYKTYNLGDIVYFDPVSTELCNSETFSLEKVKSGTSTCYKWRVIETTDSSSKKYLTIMLNYNLINKNAWSTEVNNSVGPTTALQNLSNATINWNNVDLLNYEYDISEIDNGYGSLNCVNGTCVNKNGVQIAQNVKARLITGEEVTQITNTIASTTWTISSNKSGLYYFSNKNYILGTQTSGSGNNGLSWLIENTDARTDSGAISSEYGSKNSGYWTLTPVNESTDLAWIVGNSGDLGIFNIKDVNYRGLRPVIEIPKSRIIY